MRPIRRAGRRAFLPAPDQPLKPERAFRRWLRVAPAAVLLTMVTPARATDPRDPVIFVQGLGPASALRALLLEEAPSAYRDARDWFHAEVDRPITIAWVTDAEELVRQAGNDPGPVAGLAVASRNLVVLYAPALQSRPERIVSVLRHEICHLVFAAATSGAEVEPPRWLNEGVAMWWSGEWDLGLDFRSDHAKLIRDANAAGNLMRFERLDGSFPSGPFFHVAYAQSRSFVEWMVQRGGDEALQRFIARLGRDEDPAPAFAAIYSLSLEDAESEWRREVGGGWLGRFPSAGVMINGAWGVLGLLVVARFVVVRWRFHRARDDEGPPGGPGSPPEPGPPTARPDGAGPLDSRE